ncbi:MAG TPA: thiopeptide-type bacteriocin biosynthesis protein [Chitinophaga sp.]|uniref:thiopeptide-type bacteriocin biosynthesis protein n=1 Tax=Chitinophaga sp. TaxID=1869181 RepID=UPI002BED3349|nr:thiopeptide-type bacteriocin biosynthesis protein [Chitinophaga sp.]HVI45572.1 thiopeptide-type bacteriocin biosynthesis protein [Chitinophaga sp.]
MGNENEWLAVHIYYDQHPERVLTSLVQPLRRMLTRQKLIQQFFFIRYFDDAGKHIRFRVMGHGQRLHDDVYPLLQTTLDTFMSAYPNVICSWRQMPYEQETERYGGTRAIQIAEQHFCDSSAAILSLIGRDKKWSYDNRLSAALMLHLSFIHATGFNADIAEKMVTNITSGWLVSAVEYYCQVIKPGEAENVAEDTVIAAFEQSYQKQQQYILPYCLSLWKGVMEGQDLRIGHSNWSRKVKRTHTAFSELLRSGQVEIPARHRHYVAGPPDQADYQLSLFYESYLHMTNNRLGLLNMDEAFVGYLLLEVIRELKSAALIV